MVAMPQIGRKLARKRAQAAAKPPLPVTPAPLSDVEFEAALDELAEGSELRTAPTPNVFSREHLYADHD